MLISTLSLSETMMKRKNKMLLQDRIAMRIADRYGLTREYKMARRNGLNPIEALEDWDMILPEERELFS
jgi:hypothetical protein